MIMQVESKTRTLYNFRNTCFSCFKDIEFPLLGDFAYGELVLQTKDGQDFFIADLIDNKTFNFIVAANNDKELKSKGADAQKILALLADKVNGKEFSAEYPVCPICQKRQRHYNDNKRTTKRELNLASWTEFESLTDDDKVKRIKEVVSSAK
jgi:hypothetical protein